MLIGRYYNEQGNPTSEKLIIDQKIRPKNDKNDIAEQMKKKFPSCNIKWQEDQKTSVWCTKQRYIFFFKTIFKQIKKTYKGSFFQVVESQEIG